MKINFNSYINKTSFQYTNLHSSTGIQSKILCIAAFALGLVAACFLIYRSAKTTLWQKITSLNNLHKKENFSSIQDKKIEENEKVVHKPSVNSGSETLEKPVDQQNLNMHLLNANSLLSGIETLGGSTAPLIDRNTTDTIPTQKQFFSTVSDNQAMDPSYQLFKNSITLHENLLKSIKDDHNQITKQIDQLKIDIAGKEKKIDDLILYLQPKRQGNMEFTEIAKFTYLPDDEITLESGEIVKAKDHVGEMIHQVKLDKEFILIEEKEASTYDPKGKYVAVAHGNRFAFIREESVPSSIFKSWFFKTHWEGNEDLPWIQLNSLKENTFVYATEIYGGELDISRYKEEIDGNNKKLTRWLYEKIGYELAIDREEKELSSLNKYIENCK